jgi:hypothetical protein
MALLDAPTQSTGRQAERPPMMAAVAQVCEPVLTIFLVKALECCTSMAHMMPKSRLAMQCALSGVVRYAEY